MPNPENLENGKPFKKGDPRINKNGRPKGSRNRSTIVREWLDTKTEMKNPFTGKKGKTKIVDAMVWSMINQVLKKGNVQAFKELMDSGFGKIIESTYNINTDMTYEEAKKRLEQLDGLDTDSEG